MLLIEIELIDSTTDNVIFQFFKSLLIVYFFAKYVVMISFNMSLLPILD